MSNPRLPPLLLIAGILVFLVVAVGLVLTRAPWWDEGFLAGPPANLATRGIFGSHVLSSAMPSADRYLYWNMPLYFILLTAWFKAFGFGIHVMRLLSVACAFGALAA
ncbi:MAG: hypothetical protein JO182_31740 [Acidobacteriaceae bacterium]|nr:hypothetical protein [Acidobacteriaceae bacterium]